MGDVIPVEEWPEGLKDALRLHLTSVVVTRDENDVPVIGGDSHWQCTCGITSPIVPFGGAVLKNALLHQGDALARRDRMVELLKERGIEVEW